VNKPKIAVYSIALNEEMHVERWFASARDADLVLLADTGSTDKTVQIAKGLGISVHEIKVEPWRFDVARNLSLGRLPEEIDVCVQLDLDEVLPEGWREKVEESWNSGNYWPIYKHVTQRYPDGSVRTFQNYFKIHPRKGFIWKYPIHEVLVNESFGEINRRVIDLEVDHLQDLSKSRSSYLDLLESAVEEMPEDWRMNHYLNREYMYKKDWVKVLSSAYGAMKIKYGWDVERASTCIWASEASLNLKFDPLAREWAERATDEAPNFYEAWHWRAHIAHLEKQWDDCYEFASKINQLSRQDHHLVKAYVWESGGFDLIALSAYNLGRWREALDFGRKALAGDPQNSRLAKNIEFYEASYRKNSKGDRA
jgi:glycosyltransferase involved in cell wall biosynthesis